jgi:hypothetical protein
MRGLGHGGLQEGAVRLASVAVLIALIATGGVLLRHATYSGVRLGEQGSVTPAPTSGGGGASLTKACSDLTNLQLLRVDLMTRTIASLRADRTALVKASDHRDASKVQAVIKAAVNLVSALKTGGDTTALQQTLVNAEKAVPCGG